ncbi:hypothetical protein [Streptomyces sp. cg35]|uniref:hypothetical protein n=1 Tax=Streptomyces sp. cg35 TaxID=3421650 RepID=UPI003D186FAD
MLTELRVEGAARGIEKFSEALLPALRCEDGAECEAPAWLSEQFSSPLTKEQRDRWLDEWRRASDAGKAQMEKSAGWEKGDWFHWVTGESGFWTIQRIVPRDAISLTVVLDAVDWPVPIAALEWLAEKSGVRIRHE